MTLEHATIFVVDDDVSARRGLSRLLRTAGYNVFSYADASEFLAAVTQTPKTCLLIDAQMPGLNGICLMEELASRGISIPAIFITADGNPETRDLAREIGAVGFFRKPVDGPALLDAIEWALSMPRRRPA